MLYALTNLFYTTLKNMVAMMAIVRELHGEREWIITSRVPIDRSTRSRVVRPVGRP